MWLQVSLLLLGRGGAQGPGMTFKKVKEEEREGVKDKRKEGEEGGIFLSKCATP